MATVTEASWAAPGMLHALGPISPECDKHAFLSSLRRLPQSTTKHAAYMTGFQHDSLH